MRILVVNCNTSAAMTAEIVAIARSAASAGTEIIGAQPHWGPESAEGFYESFITAAAVLDLLAGWTDPIDAVIMAGFGEHGREGARQLLDVPVVDITEAAAQLACLVSHRFGVVTTVPSAVAPIEESLLTAGLRSRVAGVLAADLRVLDVGTDLEQTAELVSRRAVELIEAGADAIVLGCAGFAGLDRLVQDRLGVPVIDGVSAAVRLSETLVGLGKSTSKAGPFAPPAAGKIRHGWPVSTIPAR